MLIVFENCQLSLTSKDWGEANLNPMVRAYGLKKDRKAKCKSCSFYQNHSCKFMYPDVYHSGELRACSKYMNRRKK